MKVGFVTWDGPAQNYMESLFVPIFTEVAAEGSFGFSTLQFTWNFDTSSVEKTCRERGFGYRAEPVLRKPLKPATALMMVIGARKVAQFANEESIDILMPRSIIPAAMVLLARRRLPGIRIVFDADGFVADERVDFAGWNPHGVTYRLFRDIESEMARVADATIVRTKRARETLIARVGSGVDPDSVFVVSNGKDAHAFRPLDENSRREVRADHGVPEDSPWIVYAGSLGPQYHPVEMARLFDIVRRRRADARFLVLTGQEDEMRAALAAQGIPPDLTDIRRVPPDEVPGYLASADLGLAMREPTFSQQAVAPIKVGEYLLTGLPVAATIGVGDVDEQIDDGTGFLFDSLEDDALELAADWFLDEVIPNREDFRRRCRERGLTEFAMEACGARYLQALEYARLDGVAPET